MKQLLSSKALRKLLILSCLVVGLVFIVSSNNTQPVSAAPCCSECQPNYESCAADCNGDSGCLATCNSLRNSCHRNCVMECEYGGGGSCETNQDCAIYVGYPTQPGDPGVLFGTCVGGNCVY